MLNKVFGYLFFLILTFWLSIRSKPSEIQPNDRTIPQNICSISPELLSISNRLCCLWSSRRDNTLRKSTFPLMSNHRHGLQFNIANSNLHILLCILFAGDMATNPGPACNSTGILSQNSQLKSLVLNARGLKSINRDQVSNQTVCNLQRFQNLLYNESSDVICLNETWLNNSISNEDILHSGFTIYRKYRKDRYGGGVLVAIKTDSFKSEKEFSPNGEEFEDLEIVSTESRTVILTRKLYFVVAISSF